MRCQQQGTDDWIWVMCSRHRVPRCLYMKNKLPNWLNIQSTHTSVAVKI